MYDELERINYRPKPFEYYTAKDLWTDEHTSKQMLQFHLNEVIDVSSRNRKFIEKSVKWVIKRFSINDRKNIADFGCGPGLYTTRFAQNGAKVTGIDFSKRSIEYAQKTAKENNLEIDYINENYLVFETEKRFDLITMIMCDFCALSPVQRKELLEKFHRLLKTDGSILLDVYTMKAFNNRTEQTLYELNLSNGFWSPDKYYGFLNTFKYSNEQVILDKYTIVEKLRTRTIYNWLQYFSKESLTKEIERSGFSVVEVLADVAGNKYNAENEELAIVIQKAI